jgi:putative mRNA 3-end processing factor
MAESLPRVTTAGLYVGAGGFFVDTWRPVPSAVVTHAHADWLRTPQALLSGGPQ